MFQPNQGQPSGSEFEPSGNRPAQNARQSTPGSAMSQSQFPGSGEAADFLGLGDEVGSLDGGFMQPTPAPVPTAPLDGPAPVEDFSELEDPAHGGAVDTLDDDFGDDDLDFDDDDDDGVHSSWVDESPPTGKSMLPKVGVAVVLGMAATAGFFAMQQGDGGGSAEVAPLDPGMNTTPDYQDRMFEQSSDPVAVDSISDDAAADEDPEETSPLGTDPVATVTDTAAGLVAGANRWRTTPTSGSGTTGLGAPVTDDEGSEDTPGGTEVAALDPDRQVEAVTERVAGLVPAFELTGETAPPGAGTDTPETEAQGLVVAGDETGAPGIEENVYWDEIERRGKFQGWDAPSTEPSSLVSSDEQPSEADMEPAGEVDTEALAAGTTEAQPAGESTGEPASEVTGEPTGDEVAEVVETLTGWSEAVPEEGAPAADEAFESSAVAEEPQAGDELAAQIDPQAEPQDGTAGDDEVTGEAPVETVAQQAMPTPQGEVTGATKAEDTVADAGDPAADGGATGMVGPAVPEGVELAVPQTADDGLSSTTRVRRIDTAQVVQPDRHGPRRATQEELKGVWLEAELPPMNAITQGNKVLTPHVGQVRVILKGNEIFQGRLYAMGEGRVWINSDSFGQMGLDGDKVDKIVRIVGDSDSPAAQAGAEDLSALENVRVKTPTGGILVGKVINRDEKNTTIVTEEGARVTLSTSEVVFLDENPGVRLKRVEQAPAKPAPKQP